MSGQTLSNEIRVVLAGAHGFGEWHLRDIARLRGAGFGIRLVGVSDPRPPSPDAGSLIGDARVGTDLEDVLKVGADIAIIATPIHTHVDLALTAAAAGADILLEKPPAPSRAEFARLAAQLGAAAVSCQVGFQSVGGHGIAEIRRLVDNGAIGSVRGIGVAGLWQRDGGYFTRSAWAGRRRLGDVPVMDGALTNPFAHAIQTALVIDDSCRADDIREVDVELYRANPIESDDTSCVRIVTRRGTTIVVAVTLCAEEEVDPILTVHGTAGRIDYDYRAGRLVLSDAGGRTTVSNWGATSLLGDLADHIRDRGRPLLVPLNRTEAFTEVLEAIRIAPDPIVVPAHLLRTVAVGAAGTQRIVISGIDRRVRAAAESLTMFGSLGAKG